VVRFWVGCDVAKASHTGSLHPGRRRGGDALSKGRSHREGSGGSLLGNRPAWWRVYGRDRPRGWTATLLEALLLERGERVFHVPGVAVNRARDAYRGEAKSDPRDARVIADQLRLRWRSLPEVRPTDENIAELRLLASHRRDLVQEQTRRIARLRERYCSDCSLE
jgi:hypothetical protein